MAGHFIGIDYGEKRIGLSFADAELGVATPLVAATQPTEKARIEHIAAIARQRQAGLLVVGYPLNMDGSVGFKAREVDAFIERLHRATGLPIARVDERLTTFAARLSPCAKRRSPAQVRAERQKGTLDSRAATLILQDYLDGRYPRVEPDEPESDGGCPVDLGR